MKHLGISLIRKKPVQSIAQVSLAASAAAPDSGFAFAHNSQGASAAIAEFSGAISAILRLVDLNEAYEDGLCKAQLRRLEAAAGEYSNSRSVAWSEMEEWKGSRDIAVDVSAAFSCAASVYEKPPKGESMSTSTGKCLTSLSITHRQPKVPGISFTEIEYFGPNKQGTSKAMGVWKSDPDIESGGQPAIVIAIRGTSGFIDSMVNANGRPLEAAEFLGLSQLSAPNPHNSPVYAHAGFLNSAVALYPSVFKQLSRVQMEFPSRHVIFTGHSAGGAVASLVFIKCLLEASRFYPGLKLSCITFGAAPALSTDITSTLNLCSSLDKNRGLIMALVNEFDIVPRADQAYVRSLIDLYLSSYNIAPQMGGEIKRNDYKAPRMEERPSQEYILPPLHFHPIDESSMVNREEEGGALWKLPDSEYHIFGDIIILTKARATDIKTGRGGPRELRAYKITMNIYEGLLYCGVHTHSRSHYGSRVELIRQGTFNSRGSWEHT